MADVFALLPRRIKVGSYSYVVRVVLGSHPELENGAADGAWGITDLNAHRIYLNKDMALDRAANVVWHEITHAINAEYGITDGAREERVTELGSNGWMQVNLDNPRLEQWLHRAWQSLRKAR